MTTAPQSTDSREGTSGGVARSTAPPWASGVVTAVETAVLSAGLVFAFVFAATASAPSADGSISADWSGAWDVGTSIWLLAHGVSASVGDVTITLVPLGLTLVVGIIAASVARRVAVPTHASVAWAALAYGLIVAIVASSAHGGVASGWTAGIVGGLVTGMGASLGLARAHGFRFFAGVRLPEGIRAGIRLGTGLSALCVVAGAAQAVLWLVTGAGRVTGVVEDLSPDLAGGLSLAAGETAYLPTLSVWGLSWLSGAGFSFGTGSQYAPGEVVPGPVPSVPLVASLPGESWGWSWVGFVVLIGLGALGRVASRRWVMPGRDGVTAQALAVVVVGVLASGAAILTRGAAGGGVLVDVGPDPTAVGWRVALFVGIGLATASAACGMTARLRARARRAKTREPPVPSTVRGAPPRTDESTDPLRLW